MGLFGPPNIEKLKAKRDVKGLVNAIAYRLDDMTVRRAAISALGTLKDARAVEPLIAVINDEDIVDDVAAALADIGDPSAVDPLIEKLQYEQMRVRMAISGALGKIGARLEETALRDRTVKALIIELKRLNDSDKSKIASAAAGAAAEALVRIGSPAVEALIAALGDASHPILAPWALGKIGDARAIQPLITMLKTCRIVTLSGEPDDRFNAVVNALAAFGTPVMQPLTTLLEDEDENNRCKAAASLGKLGDTWVIELLLPVLKDEHFNVRKYAANALELLGWKPGNDETGALFWIGKQDWEKCAFIGAPAVQPLITALQDKNPWVRLQAAKTLDGIPWRPHRNEKGAAYWIALEEWKKCIKIGGSAVEPLVAVFKYGCATFRQKVAWALGELKDVRAVEPLIAALNDDNDRSVREAAATALVGLYQSEVLDEEHKQMILACRPMFPRHEHNDFQSHHDEGERSCFADYNSHTDQHRPGVDFPL